MEKELNRFELTQEEKKMLEEYEREWEKAFSDPNAKELCDKLNSMIPIKNGTSPLEDMEKLHDVIRELNERVKPEIEYGLSFHRDIYINNGFSTENVYLEILYSGKVKFVLSDDPIEHPGVVAIYFNHDRIK